MGTTGEYKDATTVHDAPQTAKSGRAIESRPALDFSKVNEAAEKVGLVAKLTAESTGQEVMDYATQISALLNEASAILRHPQY